VGDSVRITAIVGGIVLGILSLLSWSCRNVYQETKEAAIACAEAGMTFTASRDGYWECRPRVENDR